MDRIIIDKTRPFHNWTYEARRRSSNVVYRYGAYFRKTAEISRNDLIRCGWIVTELQENERQTRLPGLDPLAN